MSNAPMSETQSLMIRKRDLSNAAAQHLLSEKGSPASLAAAMLVDVKRIKASLNARIQADLIAVDPQGNIRVVEVKGHPSREKDGFFTVLFSRREKGSKAA